MAMQLLRLASKTIHWWINLVPGVFSSGQIGSPVQHLLLGSCLQNLCYAHDGKIPKRKVLN